MNHSDSSEDSREFPVNVTPRRGDIHDPEMDTYHRSRQACITGATWMHKETGEVHPFRCGSWKCATCGPKKEQKLYAALVDVVQRWGYVRMWTVTLKRREEETPTEHRKRLARCWHSFVGRMRGRRGRGGFAPAVQYVRITELHPGGGWQNGFRHYHILVSQYIDARVFIAMWKTVTSGEGSAHVKGVRNVKKAVSYVCKYVSKGSRSEDREKNEPIYTRSHGLALYKKRESTGMWMLLLPWKNLPCLEGALETLPQEMAADAAFLTTPEGADPPDWDDPDRLDLFGVEMQLGDAEMEAVLAAICD